jgi:hypothetical protein
MRCKDISVGLCAATTVSSLAAFLLQDGAITPIFTKWFIFMIRYTVIASAGQYKKVNGPFWPRNTSV